MLSSRISYILLLIVAVGRLCTVGSSRTLSWASCFNCAALPPPLLLMLPVVNAAAAAASAAAAAVAGFLYDPEDPTRLRSARAKNAP